MKDYDNNFIPSHLDDSSMVRLWIPDKPPQLPLHTAPGSRAPSRPKSWRYIAIFAFIIISFSCHSSRFCHWYNDRVKDSSHYPTTRNPAYLIEAKHGAVASENLRCSNMGVNVMKEGGNAVDAAIATTLCVGVVNMFS